MYVRDVVPQRESISRCQPHLGHSRLINLGNLFLGLTWYFLVVTAMLQFVLSNLIPPILENMLAK